MRPQAILELRAWLGHTPSQRALGDSVLATWQPGWQRRKPPLSGHDASDFWFWLRTLELWGVPVLVRGLIAIARSGLPEYEATVPGDARPRRALEVAWAWCDAPSKAALGELEDALDEVASASLELRERGYDWQTAAQLALTWAEEPLKVARISAGLPDHRFNQGSEDPRRYGPPLAVLPRGTNYAALRRLVSEALLQWLATASP